MNGEHPEPGKISSGENAEKRVIEEMNDHDRVVPLHTNEYAQLLSSWPKVR